MPINGTIYMRMIITFIKNLNLRKKILVIWAIIFILAGALTLFRIISNTPDKPKEEVVLTQVILKPVSDLAFNTNTVLSTTGTIRSKAEADLRSEVPGRIIGVYAKVGTWVKNGTLIAEVENSSQKAQVTQALGALQAAKAQAESSKAQLSKIKNGTRDEQLRVLEAAYTDAKAVYATAQNNARNTLLTTYATVNQNIIHGTDALFRNPSKYNPKIDFTLADADLRNKLSAERVDIRYILDRHANVTLSEIEDIRLEIAKTLEELQKIKRFYDELLRAIDKAILPDEVAAQYAETVVPARSAILVQIQALTGADEALVRSENAVNIAKANLDQGITGAQQEDIDAGTAQVNAAEASVTSALGNYQAALSALEKTRIRASISGTLASFSARRGDFVGTQTLGKIIGIGGTEVVFNIPSTDRNRVAVGDTVRISGNYTGTITTIADNTNGITQQLEVRADISTKPKVPNGSTVTVDIIKTTNANTKQTGKNIPVPINAIKFNTDNTVMFSVKNVDDSYVLVAIPVTLGDVFGSMVEVSGIDADTLVVTDARGLSEGQYVKIQTPQTQTTTEAMSDSL